MIIVEGIAQIPKKLDQWQVCQKKYQEFHGKNDKCARWIWKFCCNDWWQLCLIQRQNKVATTAGKCAKATGKNHFQTKKAVVPIQKITIDCNNHRQMCLSDWAISVAIDCNNHRQMCLSDWAISVATTTGKCAKVIERKHQVATIKQNRDNVPPQGRQQPLTIEMLLDLPGIKWSIAGTKRQKKLSLSSPKKNQFSQSTNVSIN